MKPKCFYTILLFLFSFYCVSQEPFIYLNTQLGNKIIKPESVIPIVDKLSGNIAVVVKHKKNAFVNLYNKNRELITELKIDKFPEGVSNLIGSCSNNFQFTLFYSNNENSKYGSLNIDFENNTINTEIDLNLNLKKEYLIGSFEEDAQVYLLSILKDSSI